MTYTQGKDKNLEMLGSKIKAFREEKGFIKKKYKEMYNGSELNKGDYPTSLQAYLCHAPNSEGHACKACPGIVRPSPIRNDDPVFTVID